MFLVYSFSEHVTAKGNFPETTRWKCSHLFVCISLNRHYQQKPVGMVSTNYVKIIPWADLQILLVETIPNFIFLIKN